MYKSWWIHEVFLCSQGIPRSKVAVTHTQWKSMEIARWPNRNPRSHRPRWPRESRSSLPEHHTCSNGSETAGGSAILMALSRGKKKGKWRENEHGLNSDEQWTLGVYAFFKRQLKEWQAEQHSDFTNKSRLHIQPRGKLKLRDMPNLAALRLFTADGSNGDNSLQQHHHQQTPQRKANHQPSTH